MLDCHSKRHICMPQSESNQVQNVEAVCLTNTSKTEKHRLTSEPSERLVYHPNDWFTIYSHTYHCGHILHQILYGDRERDW